MEVPTSIKELVEWLEMDPRALSAKARDERMPAAFKDGSHIDNLCSRCQSIPWLSVRERALARIEQLLDLLPKSRRRLNRDSYCREDLYEHPWTTARETAETALDGCHFCTLVLLALFSRAHEIQTLDRRPNKIDTMRRRLLQGNENSQTRPVARWDCNARIRLVFSVGRHDVGEPIGLALQAQALNSQFERRDADLTLAIDSTSSFQATVEQRQRPSTLSSCRYWLDVCSGEHKQCAMSDVNLKMPTRVIRLRRENGTLRARLFHTRGLRSRYVALSHRWTTSRSVLLTFENIHSLEHEINIADLSRTFHEAFELTVDLGFEYIWIDLLCILQDSKDD